MSRLLSYEMIPPLNWEDLAQEEYVAQLVVRHVKVGGMHLSFNPVHIPKQLFCIFQHDKEEKADG